MQWKHPGSLETKMFKVVQSAGKVVLTVFVTLKVYFLSIFKSLGKSSMTRTAQFCRHLQIEFAEKDPGY
jgi:hypothetical protein